MNRQRVIGFFILAIIFIIGGVSSGCRPEESSFNPTGPSTEVTARPGDTVILIEGLLAPFSWDEIIRSSDAILIGEVVDILPAKWGTDAPGDPIIYTDVVIQPERYLYGRAESGNTGIWVRGGRVGNDVVISDNEAVFYLGEKVIVFLFRPSNYQLPQPPEGINPLDYYIVTGSLFGKWEYADGKAANFKEDSVSVSEIEKMIAEIHGAKEQ